MGSASQMNTQHWAQLYYIHPKLKNHDIACIIELVKLSSAKKYTRETVLRVMFIYTNKKAISWLKKIWKVSTTSLNFVTTQVPLTQMKGPWSLCQKFWISIINRSNPRPERHVHL